MIVQDSARQLVVKQEHVSTIINYYVPFDQGFSWVLRLRLCMLTFQQEQYTVDMAQGPAHWMLS